MAAAEPEIVAFTCNWCAYAGADYAGVSRIQYPSNVRVIRVMCSGRVEPSFILRALEEGADGVLVGGCHEADCHYISGNTRARERVEGTKELLSLLGLGADRLRIKWVNANEGEAFAAEISDFTETLRKMGPNPLKGSVKPERPAPDAEEIMSGTDTYLCVECGKCTASCPVARRDTGFSPRRTVEESLEKMRAEVETGGQLWDCLTCGTCEERCPYNVRFSRFVRDSRVGAKALGLDGNPARAGLMYSWMRMMASERLEQERGSWLEGLETKEKAGSDQDVMFFVGCLPHFDVSHAHVNSNSLAIARDSVSILNALGVTPVVLPDERCCGHDLLFAGDPGSFEALAAKNAALIKEAGVSKIVISCPEGYQTLAQEYPRVLGDDWVVEVVHITEFISGMLGSGKLVFKEIPETKVTFQDPCRLGRYMGVFDAPRRLLEAIPGVELVEMPHCGRDAICCGVSSWVSCGATARSIQEARLQEAAGTGADVLVTACPKCQIHLRCAMSGRAREGAERIEIPVEDITSLVARALDVRSGGEAPAGEAGDKPSGAGKDKAGSKG